MFLVENEITNLSNFIVINPKILVDGSFKIDDYFVNQFFT